MHGMSYRADESYRVCQPKERAHDHIYQKSEWSLHMPEVESSYVPGFRIATENPHEVLSCKSRLIVKIMTLFQLPQYTTKEVTVVARLIIV